MTQATLVSFSLVLFGFLQSSLAEPARTCDAQQTSIFESYIGKRQTHKLALRATKFNVDIKGVRIEKSGGRTPNTFEGQYRGLRTYSHSAGAKYVNGKYSGDELFHDGPLWAPGPIKIFVDQDEEMNGPLKELKKDELSRVNLKNYKLVGCEFNGLNEKLGVRVHRFHIAPRAEIEGLFEGYIDADPATLLTLAEVSKRTVLSEKAKSKMGGRMTEFNFERLFQIVDGKISVPAVFRTRGKSTWSWYTDVSIEARFQLVDYKYAEP
jgi:hypothetical protein